MYKSLVLPLLTPFIPDVTPEGMDVPRNRREGSGERGACAGSTALSWGKTLLGAGEDTAAEQKAVRWAECCWCFTI